MIVQIPLQRTEVGVRVLAGHEAQLHELACGVIDEDRQRTGIATLLEPAMIAPIDLDDLTVALASKSGLVKAPALLTRQPQPILDHPCPQRLAAYLDVMLGEQDFGCQRRPKSAY
jgi:hypothetical protein